MKFHGGLQGYLLTCQANSAFLGRFFCTGQQQLWRPSWNFKIIFLDHFSPSYLSQKWCQISVRIYCVLSDTRNLQCFEILSNMNVILFTATKRNMTKRWQCTWILDIKMFFNWSGNRHRKKHTKISYFLTFSWRFLHPRYLF